MSLINVYQMAEAREFRHKMQDKMIKKNNLPVISFTLNIPGPEKNSALYRKIHNEGISVILDSFKLLVIDQITRDVNTGNEAYFSLNSPAIEIKKKAIEIEDDHLLGRIFDIDVIDIDYQSVSRRILDYAPRKCLICCDEAAICSRSRNHSVEELLTEIQSIAHMF
jgi:holo-ACP synthase